MISAFHATKLVVADVAAAETFYKALGMTVVSRNTGGEDEVSQEQSWLCATGAEGEHMLILTRFLECPTPTPPVYPAEIWLCFQVADVDATLARVEAAGGRVRRAGEDRPEHGVRAAVVEDHEGHVIEIVGPMVGEASD